MPVCELLRISMTAADLPRAAAFYSEALGFVPNGEREINDPAWARLMGVDPTTTAHALILRMGTQPIELVRFRPPGRPYPEIRAANDRWFQHIAIVVDDIEAVWSRLERQSPADITIGGPQLLPPNTGKVTAFKFRDPEGHPLELLHFPEAVGDEGWHASSGAKPLGYDHSAIVVGDIQRSIAFYTELLGFRVGGRSLNRGIEQDRLDGLSGCEVDVVELRPAEVPTPHLELLGYRPPSRHGATIGEIRADDVESTRQVLRVDDLDALVTRLQAAGVTFVSPGIVTLADASRAATLRDPDGHMIVLAE
jgi:catechol 2,3-dioxygenase-like lactoylglutathione lyase family enzyme